MTSLTKRTNKKLQNYTLSVSYKELLILFL